MPPSPAEAPSDRANDNRPPYTSPLRLGRAAAWRSRSSPASTEYTPVEPKMSTVDTAALSGRAGTVGGIYGTIAAVVLVVGGLAVVARYIQLRSGSDI